MDHHRHRGDGAVSGFLSEVAAEGDTDRGAGLIIIQPHRGEHVRRGAGARVAGGSGAHTDPDQVERVGDGEWRVSGDAVERLIARHDLENDEALVHVEHRLRRMGVIGALEARGFEPGDDVEIGGVVFELDPS